MASNSNSNIRECRPPMLKDLLLRDLDANNSCSSSGFNSFPRRREPSPAPATLQRSRSRPRAAADATISALQRLLNAVRSSVKSSSSSSSSPSKKKKAVDGIRVKDILRWKSFRDLIDGQDYNYAVKAVVGGENGVTAGDENGGTVGGEDPMWVGAAPGIALHSHVGPTQCTNHEVSEPIREDEEEEKEQQSPVSVLDSPLLFRDKQDSLSLNSSFDQSLANVERKRERLLQSIKWFESLAAGLDPVTLDESSDEDDVDEEEEEEEEEVKTHLSDDEGKAHLSAGRVLVKGSKEEMQDCIRDMEEEAHQWVTFEDQYCCTLLGSEMEMGVLNVLLDELLFELIM